MLFKKGWRIRDIILPKKRDKTNTRYGFVKMFNKNEVPDFIRRFNGYFFKGCALRMDVAVKNKNLSKPSSTVVRPNTKGND